MMRSFWRRSFLGLAVAVLMAGGRFTCAQATEVRRIGELWLQSEAVAAPYHDAFVEGLRERGYIEGKNLSLVTRYANGDESRLAALVDELLKLQVEALFVSHAAIAPARKATTNVPIICATMNDPVGSGYAISLSRPGGNVTGLSWQSVDTATKRLELALELKPRPTKLAIVFDPADSAAGREAHTVAQAAREANIAVSAYELNRLADIQPTFALLSQVRPQALYVVDSAATISLRNPIAAAALAIHVPLISEARVWADSGGVVSYGAKLSAALKRGAGYVDRILRGVKPQELPIEQPTEFELVVNLKSAKAVGVTVPQSMLSRADEVLR